MGCYYGCDFGSFCCGSRCCSIYELWWFWVVWVVIVVAAVSIACYCCIRRRRTTGSVLETARPSATTTVLNSGPYGMTTYYPPQPYSPYPAPQQMVMAEQAQYYPHPQPPPPYDGTKAY